MIRNTQLESRSHIAFNGITSMQQKHTRTKSKGETETTTTNQKPQPQIRNRKSEDTVTDWKTQCIQKINRAIRHTTTRVHVAFVDTPCGDGELNTTPVGVKVVFSLAFPIFHCDFWYVVVFSDLWLWFLFRRFDLRFFVVYSDLSRCFLFCYCNLNWQTFVFPIRLCDLPQGPPYFCI